MMMDRRSSGPRPADSATKWVVVTRRDAGAHAGPSLPPIRRSPASPPGVRSCRSRRGRRGSRTRCLYPAAGGETTNALPTISISESPGIHSTAMHAREGALPGLK